MTVTSPVISGIFLASHPARPPWDQQQPETAATASWSCPRCDKVWSLSVCACSYCQPDNDPAELPEADCAD